MRKIFVLKNLKTNEIIGSSMLQPLADIVKKDRRTLLNWYNNPSVGEKNGYKVYKGRYIIGKKGNQDLEDIEF